MNDSQPYKPPLWLKNRHIQTILGTTELRRKRIESRAEKLISSSTSRIITTKEGVQLKVSQTPPSNRGHIILLHGWEGSVDSLYLLSLGTHLLNEGFQVSRLNFRDHGDTAHLNKAPFTSTRLKEITDAVCLLIGTASPLSGQTLRGLVGFSLGGNFALRIASDVPEMEKYLDYIIAISPLTHPPSTVKDIKKSIVYDKYFTNKWKCSLNKKLALYPELEQIRTVVKGRNLGEMHQHFAPAFSEYPDCDHYLNAYSLLGERMKDLAVDSHIIASIDDPIIDIRDINAVAKSSRLKIDITRRGGHCAFLKNRKLESWADDRIMELINQRLQSKTSDH